MKTSILNNTIDISALLKARDFLTSAIAHAQSDLEKAGAIQSFEITYELAWKTMKRILSHKGVTVNSPREVYRASAKEGIIQDPEVWFNYIEKRNLTTHTYNLETAEEVFNCLPAFEKEVNVFIETIQGM